MIISVGHVAFDLIANVKELPKRNSSRPVSECKECFGGGGGNFAVGVAKLGEPAALFSVVGEDFKGSAYEKRLNELGIESVFVSTKDPTARSWMFFEGNDYHSYFSGAFNTFKGKEIPESFAPDIAHFTANKHDFVFENMKRLKERNPKIKISFDPSYDIHFYTGEEMRKCLQVVDYFFCNKHELEDLKEKGVSQKGIVEAVDVLKVTEGAKGCTVYTKEAPEGLHVDAVKIDKISNAVGAGDAHAAGFLVAQQKGLNLEKSAKVANFVAGAVIQKMGPQDGFPTWKEVKA